METLSLVTMISVLTVVWGGFLAALILAIRREARGPARSEAKKQQKS